MFVRMLIGLLAAGVMAHATVPAPVHCELKHSA